MTAEQILTQAAENGQAVAVTRTFDGKVFTGVPVATGDRLTFSLRTGKRGRPPVFHADDDLTLALVEATA